MVRPTLRGLAIAGVAALAVPTPGHACSLVSRSRDDLRRHAQLAVVAKPEIATVALNDDHWAGTVTLRVTKVTSNEAKIDVPQSITLSFYIDLTSERCGSWTPDDTQSEFFIKIENGQFLIDTALEEVAK